MSTPIALVTGGSRGLGRSIALKLAERGTDVIITYHSREQEAREVVAAVQAQGRRALALQLDIGDSSAFAAFASAVRAGLARVFERDRFDYLVNNAGMGVMASFAETTHEQFDTLVNVHFKGTFFLTQTLLPVIADGGRIVNIASGLTRYTYPGVSAYAAVKGAVEVLTRYLARELGPRGITANVVSPGGIATEINGGAMLDPNVQRAVGEQTALGRIGQPDDIGGLVALLVAPENGWMTGQRLEVTGGFLL